MRTSALKIDDQQEPARAGPLVEQYMLLAEGYLAGDKGALRRAYQLGQRALAGGHGVMELARVHHQATMTILLRSLQSDEARRAAKTFSMFCSACPIWYSRPDERADTLEAMQIFFGKIISPFSSAQKGLRRANTALRRLNEMREEEATRIAHALHDEAAQLLASVHLALEDVALDLEPPKRERLRSVRFLLDQIEDELRRLSHELSPTILDNLGLPPALEYLAEGMSRRFGVPISVEAITNGRLPMLVENTMYRVVQEALNNAAKHAEATSVTVRLSETGSALTCSVRDNGVGFKVSDLRSRKGERGFGLTRIRERLEAVGGSLSIRSRLGRGTELAFTIPIARGLPCNSESSSRTTTSLSARA